MRVFRPGTEFKFLAKLLNARIMSRAPKLAMAAESCTPGVGFGDTDENLTPLTTAFNRSASSVKFCAICSLPP